MKKYDQEIVCFTHLEIKVEVLMHISEIKVDAD